MARPADLAATEAQASPVGAVAARLRATLEELGDALAGGDLDRLLAIEPALAMAAADVAALAGAGSRAQDGALTLEIERARRALQRCGRLGACLGDFVRLSCEARGLGGEYSRQGVPRPADHPGGLDTRI